MQETWVWSLGGEDLLGKEMATHSRILAWKIPWTEEPGRLQSMGLKRVGHDWVTSLHSVYKLNKQGENIQPWCTPFPIWNKSVVPCLVLTVASWPAYRLNKQGDNLQPWLTPFPIWNQSIVPCLVLTVASWTAYRFLRRQVRCSDIPILWRIFQFVVIHTVKSFGVVIKAEVDVFLELSCFFDDPTEHLAIWSLVPLPFLKPAWTSGSSWFTYCWSLVWRILSITLLACEMRAIVR